MLRESFTYRPGARHYQSQISRRLSVDPLAEKYPGWSPYNYTADNPVMLVDPDGRAPDTYFVNSETGKVKYIDDGIDQIIIVDKEAYNRIDFAWFKIENKDVWSINDEYFQILEKGEELDLNSDLGKIIRTVYAEMKSIIITSDVDRQVVAETIINRKESELYGETYSEILTQSQYNAVGSDVYKNPFKYISLLRENYPSYFDKYKDRILGIFMNSISVSYRAYYHIGNEVSLGAVNYVTPPAKSNQFDGDKNLINITSKIKGLKSIIGVWKRKKP